MMSKIDYNQIEMFLKDSIQKSSYDELLQILKLYESVLQQMDRDLSQTETTDWIRDRKSGELAKLHEASFSAFINFPNFSNRQLLMSRINISLNEKQFVIPH